MFGPLKKLPRLLQWDGRTRSSRQEEPLLHQLARKHILLRLAVVWLTTLIVTAFAGWWGEPMRYRAGEVFPHDLRARVEFTVVNHVELVNQANGEGKGAHEDAGHPDRPVFEKYPRGM